MGRKKKIPKALRPKALGNALTLGPVPCYYGTDVPNSAANYRIYYEICKSLVDGSTNEVNWPQTAGVAAAALRARARALVSRLTF